MDGEHYRKINSGYNFWNNWSGNCDYYSMMRGLLTMASLNSVCAAIILTGAVFTGILVTGRLAMAHGTSDAALAGQLSRKTLHSNDPIKVGDPIIIKDKKKK